MCMRACVWTVWSLTQAQSFMRNQEQILLLRKQPGHFFFFTSKRSVQTRVYRTPVCFKLFKQRLRFTALHLGFRLGFVENAAKDTEEWSTRNAKSFSGQWNQLLSASFRYNPTKPSRRRWNVLVPVSRRRNFIQEIKLHQQQPFEYPHHISCTTDALFR